MAILLNSKQKMLRWIITFVLIINYLVANFVTVAKFSYRGGGASDEMKLLDAWVYYMQGLFILFMLCVILFSFIGKRIPLLISGIVFVGFELLTLFSLMSMMTPLWVIPILLAVITAVLIILYLMSKEKDYVIKIAIKKDQKKLLIAYSAFTVIGCYAMRSFDTISSFMDGSLFHFNFYGVMFHKVVNGNPFEIAMVAISTASMLLWWYNHSKYAFYVSMVYALGFIVAFFMTIDFWARTPFFWVDTILGLGNIVSAILLFKKSSGGRKVLNDGKEDELSVLLNEGVITKEEYDEKMSKLKQ